MNFRVYLFIWVGMVICGFMIGMNGVKAQTYSGEMIVPSEYISDIYMKVIKSDGTGRYEQGRFVRKKDTLDFLYCLQPFVDVYYDSIYQVGYDDYETYLSIDKEVWEHIRLIAYYGYGYQDDSVDHVTDSRWYTITQLMIWRVVDPSADIYFTDTLNGNRNDTLFLDEIEEIEQLVMNHYQKPVFSLPETISIDESIVLEDQAALLSEYEIVEAHNVDVRIDGNVLYIKGISVGDASFVLAKKDRRYVSNPIIYYHSVSQDLLEVGSYEPLFLNVSLNVVGGQVELFKKDYDTGSSLSQGQGKLSGAVYGVYDNEDDLLMEITTNDDGYAISDYLPFGEYYLQEISPSLGYQLDLEKYYFHIDENHLFVRVNVYEKVISRNLCILKVDRLTKEPLQGVLVDIYTSDDVLVSSLETNSDGIILLENLPYGSYYVVEKEAPDGYLLLNKKVYFDVLENGDVIEICLENQKLEMPETFSDFGADLKYSLLVIGFSLIIFSYRKQYV